MLFNFFLIPLFTTAVLAGYSVSKGTDYDDVSTGAVQPTGAHDTDSCLVSVPDYITEEIEPPVWLGSWDAASFYTEDCSQYVLELPEDTTVEYSAKMYVFSYTKNHNVTDWIDYLEQHPDAYHMLDKYWETSECDDQHEESAVPSVDPKDSAASLYRPINWALGLAMLIV